MSALYHGKARRLLAAAAVLAVTGGAVWAVTSLPTSKEGLMTSQHGVTVAPGIATQDLARVAGTRVFFGHQSVGMNILDGVRGVYAAHGMTVPAIGEGRTQPGADGGFIDHAFIGENGDPLLKIRDFAAKMRSGAGRQVDVAMMKFCYVDINAGTDVHAVFDSYRTTMAALAQQFPRVTFVAATVPLTAEPGLRSKVKSILTGNDTSAADNVAREKLNALIRHEYAGEHLFDLAAAESTTPDGHRVTGSFHEQDYDALYSGYAADIGHLNAVGAHIAAIAWLKAIAQASRA